MANWNQILDEINSKGSLYDTYRRQYLERIHEITGRNIIIYYSGWLQKGGNNLPLSISDMDKTGFMTTLHDLDHSKGLDLFLHTPGGESAATESLVQYLRSLFGQDIRVFIPHMAMSAGTMIALSAKEIFMGKQSNIGPIDPQFMGIPAHGIIEEFEQAKKDIAHNPASLPLWQVIISKYNPTLLGECQKAIEWSKEMVLNWLKNCMFSELEQTEAETKATNIVDFLSDHILQKSHSRHIDMEQAKGIGIVVRDLEENQELQEAVMNLHYSCILTFEKTPACKIIENHKGIAYISMPGNQGK